MRMRIPDHLRNSASESARHLAVPASRSSVYLQDWRTADGATVRAPMPCCGLQPARRISCTTMRAPAAYTIGDGAPGRDLRRRPGVRHNLRIEGCASVTMRPASARAVIPDVQIGDDRCDARLRSSASLPRGSRSGFRRADHVKRVCPRSGSVPRGYGKVVIVSARR
jgi:hypothetical protein